MSCHYLEENRYQKICKAKGLLAPSISELRQYCYKVAYDCPVYKIYIERLKTIDREGFNPVTYTVHSPPPEKGMLI